MLTEEFPEGDGRRVWLGEEEIDALLEVAGQDGADRRLALALGVRCGLRSAEIVDVAPAHIERDDTLGDVVRVIDGKGSKPRETPIPPTLAERVRAVGDVRDAPETAPVVERSTRTLRRWVAQAAGELQDETGDERWRYLSPHDLRRTWAGRLAAADVDHDTALLWGGWEDLDTFLDHYRGEATPEEQRREREKVGWL